MYRDFTQSHLSLLSAVFYFLFYVQLFVEYTYETAINNNNNWNKWGDKSFTYNRKKNRQIRSSLTNFKHVKKCLRFFNDTITKFTDFKLVLCYVFRLGNGTSSSRYLTVPRDFQIFLWWDSVSPPSHLPISSPPQKKKHNIKKKKSRFDRSVGRETCQNIWSIISMRARQKNRTMTAVFAIISPVPSLRN